MTYEEWRATAVWADDLREFIPDSFEGDERTPGWVFDYDGEGAGDWIAFDPRNGCPVYWSPITGGEIFTADFERACRALWNGYVRPYHEAGFEFIGVIEEEAR